ncbi:site-specific DNA-methyltransferase [Stenotrophomonas sp. Sm6012]|uniref:site-specific DNA-methyltransferase n=1 Tax=Stenotrophomonas sp. Sm6012 TaxID=3002745 RepID=UPI0027E4DBF9|nr:site-specific DNA-methyltransferase [Stenotrophomonas sp. Sm6012]MDQ7280961.1 site-specific DNA-methyltransferase [Stenotrophomonas sp. Sm6012]
MDKLKMHSPNLTHANLARLRELFPGCVTEAKDEDGGVKLAVDFDQLRQELSAALVEGPQERYHLNWPGKREALLTANAPIAKTLRPVREESVDFDTTKNLFIEGDNLDALKLLQETYLGKVKVIYIDPPYNTGNDFIYEDDFAENADEYLRRSNQQDEEGSRLMANTAANGRFHSDWLTMIYPRLKLAFNLLKDDGFIFISIDDNEVDNLKRICSEIFGADNFVATFVWQKTLTRRNDATFVSNAHEYVVCYARNQALATFNKVDTDDKQRATYTNRDNDPRGDWLAVPFHAPNIRPNLTYPITTPSGRVLMPPSGRHWSTTKEQFDGLLADGRIYFGKNGDGMAQRKKFWSERDEGMVPWTWWPHEEAGENRSATKEIKDLFDGEVVFTAPKPTKLIQKILELVPSSGGDIVIDFFAGSATTADAIMRWSAAGRGDWRFLLVQAQEECNPKQVASKLGYATIADISKERIRRCGKRLGEERGKVDSGFRVLKVDTSNMMEVFYAADSITQGNLLATIDNIKPDRVPEDLLFQVMLDWGVDLALPIEKKVIQGKDVYFVDTDALAACFDKTGGIDDAFAKELATHKPLRAVFRDAGFKSDDVKINIEQIFKLLSPCTEVRCL